jgi:hypothetical protein
MPLNEATRHQLANDVIDYWKNKLNDCSTNIGMEPEQSTATGEQLRMPCTISID